MSTAAYSPNISSIVPGSPKPYDYLLKFLLVGDSDVGKEELLGDMDDGATESPYGFSSCGKILLSVLVVSLYSSNSKKLHRPIESSLTSMMFRHSSMQTVDLFVLFILLLELP